MNNSVLAMAFYFSVMKTTTQVERQVLQTPLHPFKKAPGVKYGHGHGRELKLVNVPCGELLCFEH